MIKKIALFIEHFPLLDDSYPENTPVANLAQNIKIEQQNNLWFVHYDEGDFHHKNFFTRESDARAFLTNLERKNRDQTPELY